MNLSSNRMSVSEEWVQLPLSEGLFLLGKRVSAVSGSLTPPRQTNASNTPGIPISNDGDVIEFLGIPYADVEPVKRWEKGRPPTHNLPGNGNAMGRTTNTGSITPSCPQYCNDAYSCSTALPTSEDCLYLHVWAPSSSALSTGTTTLVPVIFFIHGGSFMTGSGSVPSFTGALLAQETGNIVVMVTYRLGLFGFLDVSALTGYPNSAAHDPAPNLGWEDLVLALQWVQTHVGSIGGDATRITLMGQSAGALSCLYLSQHPKFQFPAKMLVNGSNSGTIFSGLILQSPPALRLRSRTTSRLYAAQLANQLGCPAQQQWSCMRNQSAWSLLAAEQALRNRVPGATMTTEFIPVHEEGVLHPFQILANTSIPVMVGGTEWETYFSLKKVNPGNMTEAAFLVMMNAMFPDAPRILNEYGWSQSSKGISPTNVDYKALLSRITTDFSFSCPENQALTLIFNNSRIFRYVLSSPWTGGNSDSFGAFCDQYACHSQDMMLTFMKPNDENLAQLGRDFRSRIGQFVKSGNPNTALKQLGSETVLWNAWSTFNPSYLSLDQDATRMANQANSHCAFWKNQPYSSGNFTAGIQGTTQLASASVYSLVVATVFLGLMILAQIGIFIRTRLKLKSISALNNTYIDDNGLSLATIHGILDLDGSRPKPYFLETRRLDFVVNGCQVLHQASVAFYPGSFTAIMGASGSGKSTLMSLLSRTHLQSSQSLDKIFLGGKSYATLSKGQQTQSIGYVAQFDTAYDGYTCRQVLTFSALLKLPSIRADIIARRVHFLIDVLDLRSCADIMICKPEEKGGGISGGQYRRLSIGVALVSLPPILLLDEPTSGLDAKSSLDLINVLSSLSEYGFTVVCTIHAPRPEIFTKFGQIVLLAHGQVAYAGGPENAVNYMTRVQRFLESRQIRLSEGKMLAYNDDRTSVVISEPSHRSPSANSTNPADFVLDVCGSFTVLQLKCIKESGFQFPIKTGFSDGFLVRYQHNDVYKSCTTKSEYPRIDPIGMNTKAGLAKAITAPNSSWSKIATLNAQFWGKRPLFRKCSTLIISVFSVWFLALLQHRDGQDPIAIGLQIKALLLCCFGLTALKNIAISFDYYENWELYSTERVNGDVGSPTLYAIHRTLYETVVATAEASASISILFGVLGLNWAHFWSCWVMFVLYYNCVTALYTLVYATALMPTEARSVSFVLQALVALFSGVWIQQGNNAAYNALSWHQYINPAYWTLSSLVRTALGGSGSCIIHTDGIDMACRATTSDSMLMGAGMLWIPGNISLLAVFAIWFGLRVLQWLCITRNVLRPEWTFGSVMKRAFAWFGQR